MTIFERINHSKPLWICRRPTGIFLVALILPMMMPWHGSGLLAGLSGLAFWLVGQRRAALYVGCAGLIALYWGLRWSAWQIPTACYRQELTVAGEVASFPQFIKTPAGGVGQRFILRLSRDELPECGHPERLLVSLPASESRLALGSTLRLNGRLRAPPSQLSPGAIPDQARWLSRGLQGRLAVTEWEVVDAPDRLLHRLRNDLAERLAELDGAPRPRAVLEALVLGEGGRITGGDWDRFRRLGVTHAFVISGLHLGMVFMGTWWLARRLLWVICPGIMGYRDWALLPATVMVSIYAALAGFSLPTQRALIMVLLAAGFRFMGFRTASWRLLTVAAIIILTLDYFALLGSSFWLSLAATGVLLFVVSLQTRRHGGLPRGWFAGGLLTQSLLVVLMLPVNLFWFGQATAAAVAANLLMLPVIAFLLVPLALAGTFYTVVQETQDNLPWRAALGVANSTLRGMEWLDQHLPAALLLHPAPLPWRGRNVPVAAILDVGQGLAVVLHFEGQTWVYDSGDASPDGFSQAEKILLPYLRRSGSDAISVQVISHPDRDHAGGTERLASALPIRRQIGVGGAPCRVGQVLYHSTAVRVTVLNGPGDDNSSSCVLLVESKGFKMLLAGDIDARRERELVRYWRGALTADVLVAAHHGSKTSTTLTFLKWVDPKAAVISAARASHFGHPHPDVLRRLASRDIMVINTADAGTVNLSLGPREWEIRAVRSGNIPYWLQLP